MKILYKVVMTDGIIERVIEDVDYVSIGRRSCSYRLRGKNQWLHSLPYDSFSHIRVLEDGKKNES